MATTGVILGRRIEFFMQTAKMSEAPTLSQVLSSALGSWLWSESRPQEVVELLCVGVGTNKPGTLIAVNK